MPDRHASTATLPLDLAPEQAACADAASARRVQVLLPLPLTGPYDYLVPPGLEVVPGSVVAVPLAQRELVGVVRSEEHTSELQSLMRISYAVFCLKKKN